MTPAERLKAAAEAAVSSADELYEIEPSIVHAKLLHAARVFLGIVETFLPSGDE